MQAIIFADRHGAELAPLCEQQCPALLWFANCTVLQYTIEDLASAGVTDILLVVSDDATEIENSFSDGAMWGVKIRYLLSRGEEPVPRIMARVGSLLHTPYLIARGDVMRLTSSKCFLALSENVTGPLVNAVAGSLTTGLALVRNKEADLQDLSWPLPQAKHSTKSGQVRYRENDYVALDSLRSFYDGALAMTAGRPVGEIERGLEMTPGLRVEKLSRVSEKNHSKGKVLVGSNTWLHKSARVAGPCIIGNDCYIDRGAIISNSIVMPGTYVGEQLSISNSIVSGDLLIQIDKGVQLKVTDDQLLSKTAYAIRQSLRQWPQRIMAAIILLASAPLWVLALLLSLAHTPKNPLSRTRVPVNRHSTEPEREMVVIGLFSTPIPVLHHLPMLWLVVRGDLLMFGSHHKRKLFSNSARLQGARQGNHPELGLLGPVLLFLPENSPEEEIALGELSFASEASFSDYFLNLYRAAKLLLSRRAWAPPCNTTEKG